MKMGNFSFSISLFQFLGVFRDITPDKTAKKLDEERKRKQDELLSSKK